MTERIENTPSEHDLKALTERRAAFGNILKDAREKAQCSILDLAQSTRISREFIVALESGKFEELPGQIFARGFVRSLSRALGVDSVPLVSAFDTAWGLPAVEESKLQVPQGSRDVSAGLKKRSTSGFSLGKLRISLDPAAVAVAGVVALGLFGVVVYSLQPSQSRKSPPQQTALVGTSEPADVRLTPPISVGELPAHAKATDEQVRDEAVKGAVTAPPTEISAKESVEAEEGASVAAESPKVEVPKSQANTDGNQTIELVVKQSTKVRLKLDKGEQSTLELQPNTYTYRFKDRADFMIYDAGSTEVNFNGKSLGSLGAKGRIRRLSFRSSEGSTSAN